VKKILLFFMLVWSAPIWAQQSDGRLATEPLRLYNYETGETDTIDSLPSDVEIWEQYLPRHHAVESFFFDCRFKDIAAKHCLRMVLEAYDAAIGQFTTPRPTEPGPEERQIGI
jgi:hypothetical protein